MRARTVPRRGFTLIELLVSLAIVTLVLAVALVRMGGIGGRAGVDAELARLRSLVGLAAQRAVIRGTEMGLDVSANGYRFLTARGKDWQPVTDERVYRSRRFPPGVHARLRVDDAPVDLRTANARAPQIVLWSSGDMTPFEITLSGAGEQRRLTGAPDGALSTDDAAGAGAGAGAARP